MAAKKKAKMKMATGSMKKMSPAERMKMMAEKKNGNKMKASITAKKPKKKMKMSASSKKKSSTKLSITAKKPKVVKHKKIGRV